jgi:hypothetical protein
MEEDSLEDIPADNYSPLMDSQDLGDYFGMRNEESPEPTVTTFIGKLKLLCPPLYNLLSTWERDHLDSVFLTDMVHQPEVGKEKYLDSLQIPPDLVDIRPMTTPGPAINQEKSPTVLLDSLAEEDSVIVLGYGEPDTSDHSLNRIISASVPSFSKNTSPIMLLTYLGKEVVARTSTMGQHSDPSGDGSATGKESVWSGGLGFELSPIKTRSAHKRAGKIDLLSAKQITTNLEHGALRGMKSLAREKA